MTIASEIQRIQTNIANAYDALEAKGATMPATENTDNLVTTIDTISSGGGDVITAANNTGSAITAGDKVWVNENNGSYSIDSFNGTQKYYGIQNVGSSNIINYSTLIARGFSYANTLNFSSIIPLGTVDTWEFYTSIKPNDFPASDRFQMVLNSSIYGTSYDALKISGLYFYFGGQTQQLTMGVCFNSSGSNHQEVATTRTFGTASFTDIKCEFTGTEYNIYSKRSGETSWTLEGTISSSTKVFQQTAPFRLGSANNNSNNYGDGMPFYGEIDLQKTYFKINGQDNWKAVYQAPNVTENTLTGYAQENIASGSTGEVLTLLPPEPVIKTERLVAISSSSNTADYSDDNGTSWTETTLPQTNDWRKVIFGDGKYVAVSETAGTNIGAYSTDGINWIQTAMPEIPAGTGGYYDICYGAGKYIAILYNTNVFATSTDGINWNAVTLPDTANWRNICYGNGMFLANGHSTKKMATSTDGINWTISSTTRSYTALTFGKGVFVAVSNRVLYYSTDGITWTACTKPTVPTGINLYNLTFGNGVFVCTSLGDLTNGYYTLISTDGINWSQTSNTESYLAETYDIGYNLRCVCPTPTGFTGLTRNGEFTFVSGLDGNWTIISNSPALSGSDWNSIVFGEVD